MLLKRAKEQEDLTDNRSGKPKTQGKEGKHGIHRKKKKNIRIKEKFQDVKDKIFEVKFEIPELEKIFYLDPLLSDVTEQVSETEEEGFAVEEEATDAEEARVAEETSAFNKAASEEEEAAAAGEARAEQAAEPAAEQAATADQALPTMTPNPRNCRANPVVAMTVQQAPGADMLHLLQYPQPLRICELPP